MSKKIPQFFGEDQKSRTKGSNLAVYTIPARNENEKPALVLVECFEGAGNVPRNASAFQDLKLSIEKEMHAVARVAESLMETLRRLSPGEIEVEFGIELGGSAGIPMITKHEGKANFKVTLKWKEEAGKSE